MAVLRMRNDKYAIWLLCAQFSHGLVNWAMGQIPCSTERISSYYYFFTLGIYVPEGV